MIKDVNALSEILEFVKKTFPEAKGALLTGSYATKKRKPNSDIDLIIFSESISQSFVEKTKIDNQKYDIIYFSTHYNYLIKELYLDINSRYGVYANMISTSRILFDEDNVLNELINFTKNVLLKEYSNLNTVEIDFKRKLISNALEDIEDIESFGEFYFSSALIVEEITNLILSYKVSTIGRGKNKATELKKVDPEFYSNVMDSIKNYNKENFIDLIKCKLDFFGGILDTYTMKNVQSIASESTGKYEILINRKYIMNSSLIHIDIFKITDFLKKNNIEMKYYYFYNDQLIINFETSNFNTKINNYLLSWILYTYNIETSDKVFIREKKTKLLPFCSNELEENIEKDMIYLIELVKNKDLIFKNNIDTFNFGSLLVEKIIDYLSIDKEKTLNYLQYSNVLSVYKINTNKYNYFQLIENRKEIIQDIAIINSAAFLEPKENGFFEDFFKNLSFPKALEKIKNKDLNLLKNNFFRGEDSKSKNESSKVLILNLYLKYMLDIINSNNQLSLITANLNKN